MEHRSGARLLTVPDFDWVVDVLDQYIEQVRPLFSPGQHPALWVTERRGRISLRRLDEEAFEVSAARNTARRTLAANLPATILADLADINISTAIQWTRQAKTDWTTYIADRAANAQHERETWYPGN